MANKDILKKDKDGNIILKEPLTKKYSVILLLILAAAMTAGSLYLLITGIYSWTNILRIIFGIFIGAYAIWMIRKREVYVITKEKFVAFGMWEVFLKDIETIVVNDAKFYKTMVITSKDSEFTVNQAAVSVPLEKVAEYLTKRLKKK